MKNRLSVFLACLLLTAFLPVLAFGSEPIAIVEIQKYGNLILSISGPDFLALGYDYGDIVTAHINGMAYDMPVGSNYSDVDDGNMICRVQGDDVTLAINMGDLATATGIAAKSTIEEEPGYRWDYAAGLETPVMVLFSMKEQGGYASEYHLHQLERTNERADYPHLTDEQFANFRAVSTNGMAENRLYRSSSPINPELGRSSYAGAAVREAGIRTVINLADSQLGMQSYPGYSGSAYSACGIIGLNLGIDFHAEDFQAGLTKGLRFLIANEGPYLLHCNEGKDRAGFVSALLECLMGASADEVVADYMTTYVNYYGVEPGTEQYEAIALSNIRKSLADAFEIADLMDENVDLTAEAEAYMLEHLRLSAAEIVQLKEKLR